MVDYASKLSQMARLLQRPNSDLMGIAMQLRAIAWELEVQASNQIRPWKRGRQRPASKTAKKNTETRRN